jgi:hypothetical protein
MNWKGTVEIYQQDGKTYLKATPDGGQPQIVALGWLEVKELKKYLTPAS